MSARAVSGWAALVLSLAVATSAAVAGADEAKDPRALLVKATAHYNLGRFLEAAGGFEAIYEMRPDQPVLLYNIAQCYRLAGESEKAIFFYRRYLATAPAAPNRAEVDQRITALDRVIAEQRRAQVPPNEPAPLDGRAPVFAPAPPAPSLPPPPPPEPAAAPSAAPPPSPPAPAPVAPAAAAAPIPVERPSVAPPAPHPAVAAASPPAPGRTPTYKKAWLWGVVAGGAAVLAGAGVGVALGLDGSRPAFEPTLGEFSGSLLQF